MGRVAVVETKEAVLLVTPSLTEIVIVLAPNWLVAGVMITPRLVPLPPRRILALGTKVGLEEVAVTTRLLMTESESPMTNGITGEVVSSRIVWPAIELI